MLFLDETPQAYDPTIFLIVLGVLFVVMLVMQFFSNKKRNQKVMDMLNNMQPGQEVTTIGGMFGKIVSVNEETGYIVLNVGTEESPTLITINKMAIASVVPHAEPVEETVENNEEENK